MRKYELMMIMNPALSDADQTDLISQIEKELTDAGIKIDGSAHPGEQKLSYRIRGSETGFYLLYTLEHGGKQGFFEVSNAFNIKRDIWRYMFTKIEA